MKEQHEGEPQHERDAHLIPWSSTERADRRRRAGNNQVSSEAAANWRSDNMSDETQAGDPGLDVQQAPEGAVQALARVTGKPRRARAAAPPARRCSSRTAAGAPCPAAPMHGRDKCRQHAAAEDPELAALVKAERSRGGAALRVKFGVDIGDVNLTQPADIRRAIAQVARAAALGQIPASAAGAVSQLMNTALRLAEVELSAKLSELEDAIDRLAEERGVRR